MGRVLLSGMDGGLSACGGQSISSRFEGQDGSVALLAQVEEHKMAQGPSS